jgi:hypothetical protein
MFKSLVVFLILIDSSIAWGESLYSKINKGEFLQVEQMYIEYKKYEAWRNPYYPVGKNDWTHGAEFAWTIGIFKRIYWDNVFHISMDETPQVRHGGWEYYLGLRVFDWLSVGRYHHSEHVFEDKFDRKFPVEDSYFVRVYLKK